MLSNGNQPCAFCVLVSFAFRFNLIYILLGRKFVLIQMGRGGLCGGCDRQRCRRRRFARSSVVVVVHLRPRSRWKSIKQMCPASRLVRGTDELHFERWSDFSEIHPQLGGALG